MYPHRTPIMQFETRDARLAREHVRALRQAGSATSSGISRAAPRHKVALLTWLTRRVAPDRSATRA